MKNNKRTLIGGIIILVGLYFLLDNLIGFSFSIPSFLFAWPIIFVLVGIVSLMSGNRQNAVLFLSLGAFFYLQHYHIIDMRTFWPLILVAVGLSFIFRDRNIKKENGMAGGSTDDGNSFDILCLFSGNKHRFKSEAFKGGRVTTVFGGSEIDLREAKAVEGATIDVFCAFGGCEIYVPTDWKVLVDTTAILGGFSDATSSRQSETTVTIRIKGLTIFGGGELRN